jgi:hypothetical protein
MRFCRAQLADAPLSGPPKTAAPFADARTVALKWALLVGSTAQKDVAVPLLFNLLRCVLWSVLMSAHSLLMSAHC